MPRDQASPDQHIDDPFDPDDAACGQRQADNASATGRDSGPPSELRDGMGGEAKPIRTNYRQCGANAEHDQRDFRGSGERAERPTPMAMVWRMNGRWSQTG